MTDQLDTDYLIVGAGAMGMAFADELFHRDPDARMVIVDRRAAPGGHWTDAYPYVRLHQPALFYGVNSQRLERDETDLASGPAIVGYFRQVMDRLQGSGRVTFLPMTERRDDGALQSLVNPDIVTQVNTRRRVVDAGVMNVQVPAMRPPPFPVADGAHVVPPNALPAQRRQWRRHMVLGGGKTGIDAILFLLGMGVPQADIHWVVPNDSWFWSREAVQGGEATGDFVRHMNALIEARDVDHVFQQLEGVGSVSRLSDTVRPTKWRCATVSRPEVKILQGLQHVIRMGRVTTIDTDSVHLERGEIPTGPDTLHIDCTANGLAKLPPRPLFENGRINLQSVVMCQQVFSAAILARLETLGCDDAARNALCQVIPHPEQITDHPPCVVNSLQNILNVTRRMPLWVRRSRLSLLAHESLGNFLGSALAVHRRLPAARARLQDLTGATV